MAEMAFRSPSKRLSSAVHGADRAARYIQWVGVWNIGLFIFTADKQTNFTVSAVGPVLNKISLPPRLKQKYMESEIHRFIYTIMLQLMKSELHLNNIL